MYFICKYLKGAKEDESRFFSAVPSDGTRDNGHKHSGFCINTRKHIFFL